MDLLEYERAIMAAMDAAERFGDAGDEDLARRIDAIVDMAKDTYRDNGGTAFNDEDD